MRLTDGACHLCSFVTQPNMYARGILFGKMRYELGDHSFVRCPENELAADIEFRNKGYFSGKDDVIAGTIKNTRTDKVLFELSGSWKSRMMIKDNAVSLHTYTPTHPHSASTRSFDRVHALI